MNMPERPPPSSKEPELAFVKDAEEGGLGKVWDAEAVRKCRTFLKDMKWKGRIVGDDADQKLVAALERAIAESYVERGLPPEMAEPFRGERFRVELQNLIDRLQRGERPRSHDLTPRMFGGILRRMTVILAEKRKRT